MIYLLHNSQMVKIKKSSQVRDCLDKWEVRIFSCRIEIAFVVSLLATKLIISLKKLPYPERLRQLKLPTLKYSRLRGDMIEVFKTLHYDTRASIKFNFNPVGSTRGNKFKLWREMCRYDIRKHSFCYRVINVWNSLPDYVVEADSVNSFQNRLDKYWANRVFF